MELIRNVSKWGNSAGILLPREWLGSHVKIMQLRRSEDVKKEIFDILSNHLEDIIGIYLVGSHARGEQEPDSDIDIIAISKNTRKEIVSGKYNISIITLSSAKRSLDKNPLMILPRLREAKPILNSSLLSELIKIKVDKRRFKSFIEDTKRSVLIDKKFIELDREDSDYLNSESVIYSLILRLRGIYLIDCILKSKDYSKKAFFNLLTSKLSSEEIENAYLIYNQVKNNQYISRKIKINTAEKLISLLEAKIKEYGK